MVHGLGIGSALREVEAQGLGIGSALLQGLEGASRGAELWRGFGTTLAGLSDCPMLFLPCCKSRSPDLFWIFPTVVSILVGFNTTALTALIGFCMPRRPASPLTFVSAAYCNLCFLGGRDAGFSRCLCLMFT